VKERAMFSDKTEALDEFVENCLRGDFARMAEEGSSLL